MTQDQAMDILKTGASVFLTGEPGAGKTHTVNRYVRHLRAHGVQPAIVASTGIAATHIGGMTVHAWSGIGISQWLSPVDLDRIASTEVLHKRISAPSVLIIDEVSMLSAGVLDMVDMVCRAVRRVDKPFGGLQTVLVGDFFQLPPVSRPGNKAEYAFRSRVWQELVPITCYLSEQYRQEDAEFLTVLAAIRGNAVDEEHVAVLRRCMTQGETMQERVTKLYSHNADVDRMNDAELAKLSGVPRTFLMRKKGKKHVAEALVRGCLSPEELKLKVGAAVMFTRNSPQEGFANGTTGTVTGFDGDTGEPVVRTREGRSIVVGEVEWAVEEQGKSIASVTQIPLRLAWAMTIHKSQGMSLDAAHMDLSQTFEYGQGYVALSRVRSLAGLRLIGCNRRALEVHPEILVQDRVFRDGSLTAESALAAESRERLDGLHADYLHAIGGRLEEVPPKAANGFATVRETHPKAYMKWTPEEEARLKTSYEDGAKVKTLAEAFGRKPGGILSRLKKLGLIE